MRTTLTLTSSTLEFLRDYAEARKPLQKATVSLIIEELVAALQPLLISRLRYVKKGKEETTVAWLTRRAKDLEKLSRLSLMLEPKRGKLSGLPELVVRGLINAERQLIVDDSRTLLLDNPRAREKILAVLFSVFNEPEGGKS